MKTKISASGYTNIILVLNMKRFIAQEDQERFEIIRGSAEFANVLRTDWLRRIQSSPIFLTLHQEKQRLGIEDDMSTEQVGFATGIFRSLFLEEYVFPTYAVENAKIQFSEHLEDNFQFRNLFRRAWDAWSIYIRPTVAGMFVVRLTRRYKAPRELIKISEDVLALQESLDVQSARRWLAKKEMELKDDKQALERIRRSVNGFLEWLGSDISDTSELLYNPVQWKIAMEIGNRFVDAVKEIPLVGQAPIKLAIPQPRLSIPLHDSYVIHHIDELFADDSIVVRSSTKEADPAQTTSDLHQSNSQSATKKSKTQVPVTTAEIHRSPLIKRTLVNLLDGTILHEAPADGNALSLNSQKLDHYFPNLRWQTIDKVLEENQASWMDEICFFTPRTAIILPSRKSRNNHLLVSTIPGATLRVKYMRYWGAIERLIEFVIEIRALSQLVERASYRLLDEIAKTIHNTRSRLFAGDIQLEKKLPDLVAQANQLRRFAAMAQGLSDPLVWCRAEYAINKARYLLEQLGVPVLLDHVDRNISSLNSAVDHVDELYAMDLAEKSNDLSVVLTLGLAALSLTLTVIMLPSFWTDTQQINSTGRLHEMLPDGLLRIIGIGGTGVAFLLIIFSVFLGAMAITRWKQIYRIITKSLNRLGR